MGEGSPATNRTSKGGQSGTISFLLDWNQQVEALRAQLATIAHSVEAQSSERPDAPASTDALSLDTISTVEKKIAAAARLAIMHDHGLAESVSKQLAELAQGLRTTHRAELEALFTRYESRRLVEINGLKDRFRGVIDAMGDD